MRFVIITGLSGAGKSQVVKCLEDMEFYCIDNMPPALIPNFVEVCYQSKLEKVALVTDLRGGEMFKQIFDALNKLKQSKYEFELLFLEASDEVLVKRYKETRRRHPLLSSNTTVVNAIAEERQILSELRKIATHIIDTSNLTLNQLKKQITDIFRDGGQYEGIVTYVESFGFKYGIPLDADLVFDVRFLPNPFYIDDLKQYTGNDKCVSDYVMSYPQSVTFLNKLQEMITFLLPHYIEEGKSQLVIAIGCTGGQHRSVTIANELYKYLKANNHNVFLRHREQEKANR